MARDRQTSEQRNFAFKFCIEQRGRLYGKIKSIDLWSAILVFDKILRKFYFAYVFRSGCIVFVFKCYAKYFFG